MTPFFAKNLSIKTVVPKTHIVWHGSFSRTQFTPYGSTNVKSTEVIKQWERTGEKKGAPYLIDRDGETFKLFDDKDWTHHLNIPATGNHYDKKSVPIMLANELQLIKENNQFYAFEYPHSTNRYLGPVVNNPWNSYQYWAALSEAQVDAALDLTLEICKKYNITPVFYIGPKWNPKVWEEATIFSHSAVKKDATDFPPFPDWVIAKIKDKGIKTVN